MVTPSPGAGRRRGVHEPVNEGYRSVGFRYAGLLVLVAASRRSRLMQGSLKGYTAPRHRRTLAARLEGGFGAIQHRTPGLFGNSMAPQRRYVAGVRRGRSYIDIGGRVSG